MFDNKVKHGNLLTVGSSTESQSTLSSSASASSDWSTYTGHTGLIGDQDKQGGAHGQVVSQHLEDEEGYTRLENLPGAKLEHQHSMDDLREWKKKNSFKDCCNCSIM